MVARFQLVMALFPDGAVLGPAARHGRETVPERVRGSRVGWARDHRAHRPPRWIRACRDCRVVGTPQKGGAHPTMLPFRWLGHPARYQAGTVRKPCLNATGVEVSYPGSNRAASVAVWMEPDSYGNSTGVNGEPGRVGTGSSCPPSVLLDLGSSGLRVVGTPKKQGCPPYHAAVPAGWATLPDTRLARSGNRASKQREWKFLILVQTVPPAWRVGWSRTLMEIQQE